MVDSAVFVVALDFTAPQNLTEFVNQILHGAPRNDPDGILEHRWFDKSFQIIVAPNGRAGVNFEHSPFDGATIVRFLDDMWADAQGLPMPSGTLAFSALTTHTLDIKEAVRIPWELSAETQGSMTLAGEHWSNLVHANQSVGLDFQAFGKEEMKTWKQSPDGCLQMAFQIAYLRLHGTSRISSLVQTRKTHWSMNGLPV